MAEDGVTNKQSNNTETAINSNFLLTITDEFVEEGINDESSCYVFAPFLKGGVSKERVGAMLANWCSAGPLPSDYKASRYSPAGPSHLWPGCIRRAAGADTVMFQKLTTRVVRDFEWHFHE